MKPNRVATLNAGKFKAALQVGKISGSVLLMILVLALISCDKTDDLESLGRETSIPVESPNDDVTSPIEESPPESESPSESESPGDNESAPGTESIIIYTDIEPDFPSENLNDYYNLDLNNDQIVDFTLSSGGDGYYEWLVIVSNPNAGNGIISVAPWYTYAVSLNAGQEIYNLAGYKDGEHYETWGILGDCIAGNQCYFYNWKDIGDKYLGLRFFIKGKTHYGWARLDVTSLTEWVIKDYAYNAIPNKPILAGQMN